MSDVPNHALRSHVTRVGFDLSLGKTHVAALIMLDLAIAAKGSVDSRHPMLRNWITAMHGLCARGLMVHDTKFDRRGHPRPGLHHHYKITKAGRMVIGLLKEAGIYQEHADLLTPQLRAVS